MRYKVTEKKISVSGYAVWMLGFAAWLPVSKDDFDRITPGDTVEMLISIVPAEALAV